MSHLSPLISPSKARHAASLAKDWAYVTAWLTKIYRPQAVPRFERNNEVLKELLALVAANSSADEEAELLHRAHQEELRRLAQVHEKNSERESPFRVLLEQVEASLDLSGAMSLEELAGTSQMLGTLATDQVTLGSRIFELTKEEFDAADQMRRIDNIQAYLQREMDRVRSGIDDLRHFENQVPAEELQQKTVLWNRETKLIGVKVGEYKERLAVLDRQKIGSPTIEEVRADQKEVSRKQERVRALEKQIAGYHDLPPEMDTAKREYQRSQDELQNLIRHRDELFEAMMTSS